jgi:inner membrane protein involved in colicin E2 resistance
VLLGELRVDYALLAGSIGVFAMLALVMFLTRRVDWYQLKLGAGTRATAAK